MAAADDAAVPVPARQVGLARWFGRDDRVAAAELGDEPRVVSVLADGQGARPDTPHHAKQAAR